MVELDWQMEEKRGLRTVKRRIEGFLGGKRGRPGEWRDKAERGGGKDEERVTNEKLCSVH